MTDATETETPQAPSAIMYKAAIKDIQIPLPSSKPDGYRVQISTGSGSEADYAHAVTVAGTLGGTVTETPAAGDKSASVSVFIPGASGANALFDLAEKTGLQKSDLIRKVNVDRGEEYCTEGFIRALDGTDLSGRKTANAGLC